MRPEPKLRLDAEKIIFKDGFISRYKKLLGSRFDKFRHYSTCYLHKSIRVNTLKSDVATVKKSLEEKGWKLYPIPWCKEGFWIIGDRLDIGNILEHQLGHMYVQESASMIPPVVLDPQPGEVVLDMCAAPGSKSGQIASYMQNTGLLIANDVQTSRLIPLSVNIQKMGVLNTIINKMHGESIAKRSLKFDRILVDAPCSGTGTIRRSLKILTMWSPNLIRKIAKTQYNLLNSAFQALKPGGVVVYSTCTLEPMENEAIVTKLLREYEDASLEDIELDIVRSPAITSFEDLDIHEDCKKCLRIYPQDNNSEGFFVAKIRKKA